jgi:hypothetical protein
MKQRKPDVRRGEMAFIAAIILGLVLGILIKRVRVGILAGLVLGLIIVFTGWLRANRNSKNDR